MSCLYFKQLTPRALTVSLVPQLALDNALAPYFEKNFGFNITDAGNLAATFGMLSARSRLLSHMSSRRV